MDDQAPVIGTNQTALASILGDFLEKPEDQRALLKVYDLSVARGISYLRVLRRRGRPLPLEEFPAEGAYRDMAVWCLTPLFIPKEVGGTLEIVRSLRPYASAPDDELANHFTTILRRHLKQGISRLEHERDPEGFNLRRALRRALRDGRGEFVRVVIRGVEEWRWTKAQHPPRIDTQPVDQQTLASWAAESNHSGQTVPARSRALFSILDGTEEFRNSLSFFAVLRALKSDPVPEGEYEPSHSRSADIEFDHTRLREAVVTATADSIVNDLDRLARTAQVSSSERQLIIRALIVLAEDWAEHCECDSRRTYLEEQTGPLEDVVYKKKYHYLWNTLVSNMQERALSFLSRRAERGD